MLVSEVKSGSVLASILTNFGWCEIRNGQQKLRLELVEFTEVDGEVQVLLKVPGEEIAPPKPPEETLYDDL